MGIKTFYKKYPLMMNLLSVFAAFFVVWILVFQLLKLYTHHQEVLQVPDVQGLTLQQAEMVLAQNDLRYEIIDSVYMENLSPGVVYELYPKIGSKVKSNRKVFITVNAKLPEMVIMPDLTDVSLRQAKAYLDAAGLNMGDTIFVPSEFKYLVLEQHHKGRPVKMGAKIPRNSEIDLIIGSGLSTEFTKVPFVVGMTLKDAKEILLEHALTIGAVLRDLNSSAVPDSIYIYKQIPDTTSTETRVGSSVNVWTTDSLEKVFRLNPLSND